MYLINDSFDILVDVCAFVCVCVKAPCLVPEWLFIIRVVGYYPHIKMYMQY